MPKQSITVQKTTTKKTLKIGGKDTVNVSGYSYTKSNGTEVKVDPHTRKASS